MKLESRKIIKYLQDNDKIQNVDEDLLRILIDYIGQAGQDKLQRDLFKQLIAEYVDISSQLEEQIAHVTTISETDQLTQIYNRMRLSSIIEYEWNQNKRYSSSVTLVMFDIDHFKQINDRYGHDVGDLVLIEMCKLVSDNIRKTDSIGRWGGEEFMLVLPKSNGNEGIQAAEKIRRIIEGNLFTTAGKVTCSFGVAECMEVECITQWLKNVDLAMYEAKESGRNQVVDYKTMAEGFNQSS